MKIESIYYNATLNQFLIVTMTDKGLTVENGTQKGVTSVDVFYNSLVFTWIPVYVLSIF